MKAMKGLSVNRMLGSIRRKAGATPRPPPASAATPAENPEVTAVNSVQAFCESGGSTQSDEVLFLPPIVDAAESSPAAAGECARIIRKYLSKEYSARPSWQYNAIMLTKILADHPGETFTRNIDDKFVETVRVLLKTVRDRGVWQLLMETLDDFEFTKMDDQNLVPLVSMWKKEKEAAIKKHGGRGPPIGPRPTFMGPPPLDRHAQNYFAKAHSNNRLPNPVELASRLEEARTSAKLLEQVVMNTSPGETLDNDLIREFADRCLSASRSMQGYMVSDNPAPDNDTMESLIDTNEQLQTALNQHKRAVLSARKHLGLGASPGEEAFATPSDGSDRGSQQRNDGDTPGLLPGSAVSSTTGSRKGKQTQPYLATGGSGVGKGSSSRHSPRAEAVADPFADPADSKNGRQAPLGFQPDFPHEPFHPGFGGSPSSNATVVNGVGSSGSQNGLSKIQTSIDRRRDDADDIYEATPKGKESRLR